MKTGWIVLLLAAVGEPAIGLAQSDPAPPLKALVASPQYQANIARLFAGLPADVFQRCSALVSKGSRVTVITPVGFAADGYPTSGSWRQSFPVSGCGNDTTINFVFMARPDEKITSLVVAPGDTHADPALQRDAVNYVRIAALTEIKSCDAVHVRTTSYDGRADGSADGQAAGQAAGQPLSRRPWRETWTLSGCGQIARIHVDFIPDATGTTISAHAETRLKP